MSLEKQNSNEFLSLLDWKNELLNASNIAGASSMSDEEWLKHVNSDYYKNKFKLKTVDERFEQKLGHPVEDDYYIQTGDVTEENKKEFFDRKQELDDSVKEFNEELKKENPDRKRIQELYYKMFRQAEGR